MAPKCGTFVERGEWGIRGQGESGDPQREYREARIRVQQRESVWVSCRGCMRRRGRSRGRREYRFLRPKQSLL